MASIVDIDSQVTDEIGGNLVNAAEKMKPGKE